MGSLAHVQSGSHAASPNAASERGIASSRGVREPHGVAGCGVKTSLARRGVTKTMSSPDLVLPSGVRRSGRAMERYRRSRHWPHLPCQAVAPEPGVASRAVASPHMASNRSDPCGDAGRRVGAWRHGVCGRCGTGLQNASSVVRRYAHPHRRPPVYVIVCIYIYISMFLHICISLNCAGCFASET